MEMIPMGNPMLDKMIENDYLNKNTLYFTTEFDRESCTLFCRQLQKLGDRELDKRDEDRKPIKVVISSYGGNVYDYYSVASMIEYYKEKGLIIETHCQGYAMSAGAKLLILGSKGHRTITKYGCVLLHQVQTGQFGRMTHQEKRKDVEDLDGMWEVLSGIIKANTLLTDEEIEGFTKYNLDITYTPAQCVEKGIVDKII